MSTRLRPLLLLVWFTFLAAAPAAHAQWAVIDVSALTQLMQQVQTMQQQLSTAQNQLSQARSEYNSITGGRGMERLLGGTAQAIRGHASPVELTGGMRTNRPLLKLP